MQCRRRSYRIPREVRRRRALAPALGDAAAWAPRIAQGRELLNQHALQGLNAMPAKGGRVDLSDEEILATVDYMLEQAGN